MNNRSCRLLDLAHLTTLCMNCGRMTEGCGSRARERHRGWPGSESRRTTTATALCHDCHSWLDKAGAKRDPRGVCVHAGGSAGHGSMPICGRWTTIGRRDG